MISGKFRPLRDQNRTLAKKYIRSLIPISGIFLLWKIGHCRIKKIKKNVFEYTIRGQVVGIVSIRKFGPVMLLESLIVKKQMRGMGVGTAILKKILQHAHARRCHWMLLSSSHFRVDARRFYRRNGFRYIGWSFFVKKI